MKNQSEVTVAIEDGMLVTKVKVRKPMQVYVKVRCKDEYKLNPRLAKLDPKLNPDIAHLIKRAKA